ncbi:Rrf2 family transcriptional regulator [Dokdonella sp.]|uniref:Rrf2 family transcriptional regulator n=1 Tax=Dokdonella sp. TaxID=2291710 RepID=UPI001B10AC63|nr:Rrf2 family transcriptional regulator [Dokdonella sp.]MBO9663395.1 Rrf2 family transcriptional regulator [Dokdonella sp.]
MKKDSRLSSVLHVLLHMEQSDGPLTSDALARMLGTNPVVVRRVLSSLRECGYVASTKGHGGGWVVACDPRVVTLLDVYRAVGEPTVFAMGHRLEKPRCLVEQSVNEALDGAFRAAEALLVERLGRVTLADLAASLGRRMKHTRLQSCRNDTRTGP